MWVNSTVLLQQPVSLTRSTFSYPPRLAHSGKASPFSRFFRYPPSKKRVSPLQTKRLDEDHERSPAHQSEYEKLEEKVSVDLGWLSAFPHVSVASMANFLFGYHIGVMNGPIVSIARELGFEGNSILEGLVVSIFIAGAFIGSISSGSLVDKLGCRQTFQLVTIPLVLGALVSAQAHSLDEILCGRFLVGLGIGVNTVLVPIYISEVAPTKYRGSLGTLCQIGTCLGIIFSLLLGSTTLRDLFLSRCNITEFPTFIKGLQNLERLDVSKNRLKGKVPEWLWNLPSMERLNLSHNSFSILDGSPKVLLNSSIWELDLSSNVFQGSFPLTPPTINVMDASNNNFTGVIPLSLCKASRMFLLDLSDNNFSGSIPRCLTNSLYLRALKLRNNNLTGILPDLNSGLLLLDVGHNQISGKLPRFLVNCEGLMFLNLENNRITDTFPFWLKTLPYLEVIVLRSNRFHGPITSPENSLPFPALRIIDISHNNFSGSLPPNYFANWSAALVNSPQVSRWPEYTGDDHSTYESPLWFYPSIYLRIKGRNTEFEKIQKIYTSIDFSGNRFEGQIPESIGHLKSLMALDLSDNSFTGHIPTSLAKLKQLESLDLSQNQLSGRIPQELSVLTFLEYINMSHNRLTGQIPQSTQIGGQDKSSFEGNLNLCGLPLQESCFKKNVPQSTKQTQEPELPKKEQMVNWKAAAISYGPGVLIGLAIGQALASYKPVLFYKLFRL